MMFELRKEFFNGRSLIYLSSYRICSVKFDPNLLVRVFQVPSMTHDYKFQLTHPMKNIRILGNR